jgi:hypothetical protein
MPIIINEFEIVAEPGVTNQERRAGDESEERPEQPVVPDPAEIIRVQRVHWLRMRRVWAD